MGKNWKSVFQRLPVTYAFRYDLSYDSCIFCDYIGGSFAVQTDTLRALIDVAFDGEPLFADIFLKLFTSADIRILNCPDVMFEAGSIDIRIGESGTWKKFGRKHHISHFEFPDEKFQFSCNEIGIKCSWAKAGEVLPACCYEILTQVSYKSF